MSPSKCIADFRYNYGAVLNQTGKYSLSNDVMYECEKYFNDYDVQMMIGDNHYRLGQWKNAETHYLLASNMVPSRFLPLYCIMKLYKTIGENEEELKMATKIVGKQVKIPSSVVHEIIESAKTVIDNSPNSNQ